MRKLHIAGIAFAAVFAFVAFSATSAFAATEWQIAGKAIATATESETTGELLLEDMNSLLKVDVLCKGIFDGTVGPGAADTITKILSSAGVEEKAENLEKVIVNSINCELMEKGACEEANGSLINVFPVHLPWATELLLPSGELVVDDIKEGTGKGAPGYEITCKSSLLGTVTDTCTGIAGSNMTNGATDVIGKFEEDATNNPPGNCSIGGEK